jgi:hypothetical protein
MNRNLVILFVGCVLATGCSKATAEECQAAADNLTEVGGLLGGVMATEMMNADGDSTCEGRFTSEQAACMAGLKEVNEETLLSCD